MKHQTQVITEAHMIAFAVPIKRAFRYGLMIVLIRLIIHWDFSTG